MVATLQRIYVFRVTGVGPAGNWSRTPEAGNLIVAERGFA
jgi:hypothetical protein